MSAPLATKAAIYAELKAILVAEFGLRDEQLEPGAHLVDDLDLDSIDWIDMAVALQVRTGRQLDETEFLALRTIQDVVDTLHRKLATSE